MDTELMYHVVCLLISQLSLLLIAPTHCTYPQRDGQAEFTCVNWLHTEMYYLHANGHPSKYHTNLTVCCSYDQQC